MDTTVEHEPQSIMETRLTHQTHRLATELLVDAADRPATGTEALTLLRDFVVANLRHHHETEDALLWPQIVAAAPQAQHLLDQLSQEHDRLDDALERLAAVNLTEVDTADGDTKTPGHRHSQGGGHSEVRLALREAAVVVRDSVRDHLTHEEPVLFPALRDHLTPAQWATFAHQVIATTPPVAGHLMIGFLDEAGTPAEVESMVAGMPQPIRDLLPLARKQAAEDLRVLRGTHS